MNLSFTLSTARASFMVALHLGAPIGDLNRFVLHNKKTTQSDG
jgi:hypothetical protein